MNVKNQMGMRQGQGGVILLEVLVAVLVFSVGILAVIGLQAAAIGNVADAKYRVDAGAIADRVIGQMWVDQSNFANYTGTSSLSELPSGHMTVTAVGSAVTVTITWQPPNAPAAHTFSTVARIYPT
jgi:type IV pilus assembly protein PilV